jgi:uncharacterized protein with NRDE domain
VCLLVLAWQTHPRYRLIVAANRDEHHERPAAALSLWPAPDAGIAGGRDLRAGGTWLAAGPAGRCGAVTNYREPPVPRPEAPSRGGLIPGYLRSRMGPGEYLAALAPGAGAYGGFNLLLADARSLWHASNRKPAPFTQPLPPGVYGQSNGLLDAPWPKLRRVREGFRRILDEADPDPEALLELLADRTQAASPADLPATGVDPAWEQTLSSPFVVHPAYGTRSSTVLRIPAAGSPIQIIERSFNPQGQPTGTTVLDVPR